MRTFMSFCLWLWAAMPQAALASPAPLPPRVQTAVELFSQGEQFLRQEDMPRAQQAYQEALDLFHEFGYHQEEVDAALRLGRVLYNQAEYDHALQTLQQAVETADQVDYNAGLGFCLKAIGDNYRAQYDVARAQQYYHEAQQVFATIRKQGDTSMMSYEGMILASTANLSADSGEYQPAIASYKQVLSMLERSDSPYKDSLTAQTRRDLAITYSRMGQYDKAVDVAYQALSTFENLGEATKQIPVLMTIGGIYEEWGQREEGYYLQALQVYKQALALAESLPSQNPRTMGILLNNMGKVFAQLGRDSGIRAHFSRALQYYQDALTPIRQRQLRPIESRILNNIGEVHLHLSTQEHEVWHLEQAYDAFQEAAHIQEELVDPVRQWRILDNLSAIHERRHEFEPALHNAQEAIDLLEEMTKSAGLEDFKMSIRDQGDAVYARAIRILMTLGRFREAFAFSERARARAFLDQIGQGRRNIEELADESFRQRQQALQLQLSDVEKRIEDFYNSRPEERDKERIERLNQQLQKARQAYVRHLQDLRVLYPAYDMLTSIAPLTLSSIQQRLDHDTTLIAYFMTQKATFAFIITSKDFQALELPGARSDIASAMMAFRELIDQRSNTHTLFSQELYAHLIAPLEEKLTTRRIGIIPHDVLHYLPFAALNRPDAPSGESRYFGDEHILFTLPSASVLDYLHLPPSQNPLRLLALANSQKDEEGAVLPFVEQEVATIYAAHPQPEQMVMLISNAHQQQATETAFREQAGTFALLHLAAHGALDRENPQFSRIFLSPDNKFAHEKELKRDGKIAVHELYELNLEQTQLAVLSACNTNLGRRSKGDDIVGLTRAFMAAGVPSVLSSLWAVNDQATSELMALFYRHLFQGASPANALHIAQHAMRERYPHPYYWAGFVLNGLP